MHKLFALLSVLMIMLSISCSGSPSQSGGNTEEAIILEGPVDISQIISGGSGIETAVSRPIAVGSGNQTITFTGLESGKLYTIYAGREGNTKAIASTGEGITLNDLGGGTYTFILPEGVTEIEFKASEIGLEDGGEFRIGAVAAPEIDFQDSSKGMTIGQGVTEPLYINADGSEVYEAFYSIDVNKLENPSNIVITEVLDHSGEGGGSHWFCFVDKHGQEIRSAKPRAVIDLSGHDIVYLYNRMIVDFSEGKDMTDSLYLLNPTPLNVNETVTLHNPSTFIIGPSSSPMYLIVNRESDSSLGIFINDINARYASTGARFPGVLPIEATEEHLIVNIPSHSEKIMFDYDGEDVTAELVPSDGQIKIYEMGMGTKTFTVPPDTFIFPIICTGSLSDCTLSFTTDIPDSSLKYTIINRDGYGAGQGMVYPGGSVSTGNGRTFDWFFFRDYERKGGTFTLTVQ